MLLQLTDLEKELMVVGGKGIQGLWYRHVQTAMCKMSTSKDLLYSTCSSAQCHVVDRMAWGVGGEWMCVCVTESPRCSRETVTVWLISDAPIPSKLFFKKCYSSEHVVDKKVRQSSY